MPQYLMLRLEAPLLAFGDIQIDAIGPARRTPAASTITGLIGNAIGVRRENGVALSRLQERLVFGSRVDRRGTAFRDFQTAQLGASDTAWTTRGRVEKRAGGANTYNSPHIRLRDFHSDVCVTLAIRLTEELEYPTLQDVAKALDEPCRPLFLGRKSCLPSAPIAAGMVDAANVFDALCMARPVLSGSAKMIASFDESMFTVLPVEEPCPPGFRAVKSSDKRDWVVGLHTGEATSYHGVILRSSIAGDGDR